MNEINLKIETPQNIKQMPSVARISAIALLSVVEAANLNMSSQAVAEALIEKTDNCPLNEEVCKASLNRLYAGNNNDDYKKYSSSKNKSLYKDPTFPAGPGALIWPKV